MDKVTRYMFPVIINGKESRDYLDEYVLASNYDRDVAALQADNAALRDAISGAMDSLESEVPAERKARWERLQALGDIEHPGDAILDKRALSEQATRAAEERYAAMQLDIAVAAGELLVDIPEPGTEASKMLIANVLMRRENATLRAEVERCRGALMKLRIQFEPASTGCDPFANDEAIVMYIDAALTPDAERRP